MRRTIGMTAHHLEEVARRPRGINRVLRRLEAVEPELAVLVCAELASQVMAGLVFRVEDVVLAVRAGLPHVEDGIGDALVGFGILDYAVEEGELAVGRHVLDDAGAEVAEGGFGGPEGAEDGGGGGLEALLGDDFVVDFVDERFYTQYITYSPGLVSVLPVCLADRIDVIDAHHPFLLCELNLPAEVVEMFDQAAENLSVSGFCLRRHQVDNVLCEERIESVALVFAGSIGAVCTVCSHGDCLR